MRHFRFRIPWYIFSLSNGFAVEIFDCKRYRLRISRGFTFDKPAPPLGWGWEIGGVSQLAFEVAFCDLKVAITSLIGVWVHGKITFAV